MSSSEASQTYGVPARLLRNVMDKALPDGDYPLGIDESQGVKGVSVLQNALSKSVGGKEERAFRVLE